MTAARIITRNAPTTVHPPLPRQPGMQEWINRPRPHLARRLIERIFAKARP